MERNVLKQAAKYSKERRRKTRKNKALSALAAVVVFCTTYALILPAVTMEHQPICGLEEHQHDESCYAQVLVCGEDESEGHTHDSSCYTIEVETEEVLVCSDSDEDHVHDSSCYETVETEFEVLTCDLEETSGHQHSDDCYELQLVCGLAEHTHTDACYPGGEEEDAEQPEPSDADESMDAEEADSTEDAGETEEAGGAGGTGNAEDAEDADDAEPVEDEEPMPEDSSRWTADETYGNRFYQAVFHVEYYGTTAEDDELAFTAQTTTQDEMDSNRDWEYLSLIPDSRILPMGRTEFALTLNGETVDRSEYSVYVEIIPSRESVAYLYMSQYSFADTMDLDSEDGEIVVVNSAFALCELVDGELALIGHMDADLDGLDIYSYMDYAYDEYGNPVYDQDYTIEAEVYGEDFMVAAGVEEELAETMAAVSQKAWSDGLKVLWDGYTPNAKNTGGSHKKDEKVASVTMTHSDSNGVKDQNAEAVKIWEGTADRSSYSVSYDGSGEYGDGNNSIGDKRVLLKGSTTTTTEWVTCEVSEATRITVNYTYPNYNGDKTNSGSETVTSNSSKWSLASTIRPPEVWGTTTVSYWWYSKDVDMTVTSVEYEKQMTTTTGTPAVYPNATTSVTDYALLEIEPEPGYYVAQVVIACTGGNTKAPTACSVWSDKAGVFQSSFGVSEGTHVSLTVPSWAFCHYNGWSVGGNANDTYYILIQTAPIPSPLFVSYEYGDILNYITDENSKDCFENSGDWLSAVSDTSRNTKDKTNVINATTVDQLGKKNSEWTDNELSYYVANISTEAETQANAAGYRFTGWKLEYWGNAADGISTPYTESQKNKIQEVKEKFPTYKSDSDDGFLGSVFISKDELNTARYLMTNAKLIAQWEPIPAAEIVKQVIGLENGDTVERTFEFTIESSDNSEFSFTAAIPAYTVVNGIATPTTETKAVSSTDGVATVSFPVRGNSSRSYQISGMSAKEGVTYTVTEMTTGDFKPTYEGQTFTVNNDATAARVVKVINDFTPLPESYTLSVEKVTRGTQGTPKSAEDSDWLALSGATFQIWDTKGECVATLTPDIGAGAKTATATSEALEYNTLYKLVETKAPAGYNMLDHVIYFMVEEGGSLKAVSVNSDEKAPDEADLENGLEDGNYVVSIDQATLTLIIANYGGYVLPSTGGPGVNWMYALGSALAAAAAATLVYKKIEGKEGRA